MIKVKLLEKDIHRNETTFRQFILSPSFNRHLQIINLSIIIWISIFLTIDNIQSYKCT